MANVTKSHLPEFTVEVFQNEFLSEGGRDVDAVITVTATGGGTPGSGTPAAQAVADAGSNNGTAGAAVVIMVDCSGSMKYPQAKLNAAGEATAAAIDTLRDNVAFAVVGGNHEAREIYPGHGELAIASPHTRDAAKRALSRLRASGGTAIGTWLRLAERLLGSTDAAIRHGILLTDGRNEHEEPAELTATLDDCAGSFTCDCRGVGTDWEVAELRRIAAALLGSVDIVADPAGLAEDFRSMMARAMEKEVADVALRLWTPQNAELKFVKQVAPSVADLSGLRVAAGPRTGDYPTGSWGDESRDYHVSVRVPAAGVGSVMLAARASLVLPQPDGAAPLVLSQGLIRAVWTDDMAASTTINPQVAHYTDQAELAQAIQQGLAARKDGDTDTATAKLGRAVQLAAESGNDDTAKLLAQVVDVLDPATGTVRLKSQVTAADEMTLETRSTKTVRVRK